MKSHLDKIILAKESLWIIIGQLIAIIGSIFLIRILTEFLDPAQYGQITLAITVFGLINQVVMGGIIASSGRFFSVALDRGALKAFFKALFNLMMLASILILSFSVIISVFIYYYDYVEWLGLAWVAVIYSILKSYSIMLNDIQNAARNRASVAFFTALEAIVKILIVLAVFTLLNNSPVLVVFGYAMTMCIVLMFQLKRLKEKFSNQNKFLRHEKYFYSKILKYAWPFSAWGVFMWAYQVSDRWALQTFLSTEEVGMYAVLFQIGYTPLVTGMSLVNNLISPILFQKANNFRAKGENIIINKSIFLTAVLQLFLTACAFLFAYLFHEAIFKYVSTKEYSKVSYLLPWVILAGGAYSAGQMLTLKKMSEFDTKSMIKMNIITAILGITLNFYGVFLFGVNGIVASLVIFSFIYLAWAWNINRKHN